jgi:hypothetical protein
MFPLLRYAVRRLAHLLFVLEVSMKTWLTVVSVIAFVMSAGTGWGQDKGSERFEVRNLKAVRPTLLNVVSALDKHDAAGAKEAMEVYDAAWNGVEVYVNFRYIDMYRLIEGKLQNGITKALNGPNPDMAQLASDGHLMLAKFDETVSMIEKDPPISPLFDDVARLRMVRANLLFVVPAIKSGDFAKARQGVGGFRNGWPKVQGLIKARSPEASDGIEKALTDVEAALKQDTPNAEQATTVMQALNLKYNDALGNINKEARATK